MSKLDNFNKEIEPILSILLDKLNELTIVGCILNYNK